MSVKFVRRLAHDFNIPTNRGGFHEVVLDKYFEPPRPGDEVVIADSEGEIRGRVRVLIAVVEPIGEYQDKSQP